MDFPSSNEAVLWFRSCTGAEETSWSSTTTCVAHTVTVLGYQLGGYSVSAGRTVTVFCFLNYLLFFILFQDHSGNASSFFLLSHPSCVIFWGYFFCSSVFLSSFKSVSHFFIAKITHQPSSWSQTSSSALRTQKCGF